MKAYIPSHIRRLAKLLGCSTTQTLASVEAMRETLKPHGISVVYVRGHHQWWISGFVGKGTCHGILKCHGIGAFIDYLNNPAAVISWWQQRAAEQAAA